MGKSQRAVSLVRRKWRGVTWRARNLAERALERRYGVRTADFVYLDDLDLPTTDRIWHTASDWLGLRRALKRLNITSDDVFVDYGSGLGRALLVAARFPFRRVIGVELSREMTERAKANIERNTDRLRAARMELVTADATEWDVPPDLTVAYLYSPFTGEVFDAVMQKLFASVDEKPRPLRILYNYPVEHGRLLATGRVRVLEVVNAEWLRRSRRGPRVIVCYLVLPQDPALSAQYGAMFPQRLKNAEQWLGDYEPGYRLVKPERLGGVALERPAARSDPPP